MRCTRIRLLAPMVMALALLTACGAPSAVARTTVASPTATTAPTMTPYPTKPPPPPTATPIALTSYPTAAQAWGAAAARTVGTGNFQVGGITPDGQNLLGYQLSGDTQNYNVGLLNIATQQFTQIDASPTIGAVNVKPNTTPGCCITNGRYFAGANGVTEGSSGTADWYYDSQTRSLHAINSPESFELGFGGGMLIYNDRGHGLYGINLATGAITSFANLSQYTNFVSFSWPYLAYQGFSSSQNYAIHLHNLLTGADSVVPNLGNIQDITWGGGALYGDTFFYTLSQYANGTGVGNGPTSAILYELDHAMTAGATATTLATLPGGAGLLPEGTNARVVLFGLSDYSCNPACNDAFAWDRAQRRAVLITNVTNNGGGVGPAYNNSATTLSGTILLVTDSNNKRVTIYDTASLPGA